MPAETTNYKAKFAIATDEVKAFPAEVSQPGQEKWDTLLGEQLLKKSEHGASFTAASGEWVIATAAITVTLPTATANLTVRVSANGHAVKVGAGAALIFGGGLAGATPLSLSGWRTVTLEADGTNWAVVGDSGAGQVSWGYVAEAGTVEAGSGDYTVAKTGTGIYEVKWTTVKTSANYAVFVTQDFPGRSTPRVHSRSVSSFVIEVVRVSPEELLSQGFSFQVIAAS